MSPPQGKFTNDEKRHLQLEFAEMYRSIHAPTPTTSNRPANQPTNDTPALAPTNEPTHPSTPQPSSAPPRQHLQYEPYALNDPAQRAGFIIAGAIEWDMWVQDNRGDVAMAEGLQQTAGLSDRGGADDVLLQPSQVAEEGEEEREFDDEFDDSNVLAWLAGIPEDLHNHNFVPAPQEALPALPPAEEEDARDIAHLGMYQSMWANDPPVQHAAVIAANTITRPTPPGTQIQPATQDGNPYSTLDQDASSNDGAMRRGSGKEVNKPGTPVTDEHQAIVSPMHFGDRNRREMLPIVREEDVNDSVFPPVTRTELPSFGLQLGHEEGNTQQATRAAVPDPSPHSGVESAFSAETYHSAYHRPNHYTGRSQAPRDLDPPELVASRARGTSEWHEWIMTNSRFPLPRPHVERQIFNSLIPTPADTLLDPPANPAAAQQALDRRNELLGEPCCICFEDIREAAEAPCGHLFCTKCAIKAAIEREKCSMCRAMMLATALTRIRIPGGEEPEFKHQKRGRLG
ncbi:unnamed protein product [Zymoseptoria tritici ST99CH_3D1]|uniref:RING-type domain-containing protein n=1 Tax=Zymoseptoria tritici ST99CH_1E4 TaxID=1276532 RepID=A0A2H1GPY8_ZYMTR|nr:unnamed protein product [Zymoseptoria tritici ST99CH_1E4]SMR57950.1 unnamed protein product [Zymoseptoria tritici ST99CH_3D1]